MGSVKPTETQGVRIQEMRAAGIGYRVIAQELNLTRDAVRYYCKVHGLAGVAEEQVAHSIVAEHCIQCGKPLSAHSGSRTRRFCSSSCRCKWWQTHSDESVRPSSSRQHVVCPNCGKSFLDYSSKARKYCSHACYIRDRFWRAEDGREPYISPSNS